MNGFKLIAVTLVLLSVSFMMMYAYKVGKLASQINDQVQVNSCRVDCKIKYRDGLIRRACYRKCRRIK